MAGDDLHKLAGRLQRGEISVEDFVGQIRPASIADVEVAQVDLDRARRCGFPEVVFGQGKTLEAIESIFDVLLADGTDVFATRIDQDRADHLLAKYPQGRYNAIARTFRIPQGSEEPRPGGGRVTIVTAGTSDAPVGEEARETAIWMGADVTMVQDIGVAGPQRLLANLDKLRAADAVVVVAGMEGALPSMVGGYISAPVIAVPTSVGYGANLGGIAALLSMLNSCAANVTVVNIDAGFKGAYVAGLIARKIAESSHHVPPDA